MEEGVALMGHTTIHMNTKDLVEVTPLKTFSLDKRIVSPRNGVVMLPRRQLVEFEARGLVRRLDPLPDAGAKLSASPVVPASPKQTSSKSKRGDKPKVDEPSLLPTPASE